MEMLDILTQIGRNVTLALVRLAWRVECFKQLCLPKLLDSLCNVSGYRPRLYPRLDVAIADGKSFFDVVRGLPSNLSIVLVEAPNNGWYSVDQTLADRVTENTA